MWVRSLQGLMTGGQVIEKGRMVKVRMIRISIGTVAETENDSSSGKTDFEPNGIIDWRF